MTAGSDDVCREWWFLLLVYWMTRFSSKEQQQRAKRQRRSLHWHRKQLSAARTSIYLHLIILPLHPLILRGVAWEDERTPTFIFICVERYIVFHYRCVVLPFDRWEAGTIWFLFSIAIRIYREYIRIAYIFAYLKFAGLQTLGQSYMDHKILNDRRTRHTSAAKGRRKRYGAQLHEHLRRSWRGITSSIVL